MGLNFIHMVLSQTASSISFAAQNQENQDFDCSDYDCHTMGVGQLCIASSLQYDEETCPFAKYCCSENKEVSNFMDELLNSNSNDSFVINFTFTHRELTNLWTLLAVFAVVNAFLFYCFCVKKVKKMKQIIIMEELP